MGEHAFPLTGFVCKEAHITFAGSGGLRCKHNISCFMEKLFECTVKFRISWRKRKLPGEMLEKNEM